MPFYRPATLFGRSAVTVSLAFIVFQVLTVAAILTFVLAPLAKRSADDLAELIILSAQTWVELPPETRPDFEQTLARSHGLWLFTARAPLQANTRFAPYQYLLETALEKHGGKSVSVTVSEWDEPWLWTEVNAAGQTIQIGFPHSRIGVQPVLALLLVLGAGILLTLATALVLARRITLPLAQLSLASEKVGKGRTPDLLPESGPEELATVARNFNRMAVQVRDLLANRTTLLAGISHDLRTPLARMNLALEMLPDNTDPKLLDRLRHDLEQMNHLIGTFLDVSRSLGHEEKQEVDLSALIQELAEDAHRSEAQIEVKYEPGPPCRIQAAPQALRRLLSNLLDNAIRYGANKPVSITWAIMQNGNIQISVLDSGPGIPEDQREAVFQPFYRIESSRNTATGGSGLGLAIARQLADSNGWKLALLPRAGGGTEARVQL
ncbi:MAG: ATP-binding protein [Sulfuricellaceae bacterium]|nr:ATP-binding protein [Sulfuricellaceae bacterium]